MQSHQNVIFLYSKKKKKKRKKETTKTVEQLKALKINSTNANIKKIIFFSRKSKQLIMRLNLFFSFFRLLCILQSVYIQLQKKYKSTLHLMIYIHDYNEQQIELIKDQNQSVQYSTQYIIYRKARKIKINNILKYKIYKVLWTKKDL